MMMNLSSVCAVFSRTMRWPSSEQAILERQRFEFGQDVSLRVEQQADRALAWREIAHVAGQHGIQVAHAIRPGQREDGAEVGVHKRCGCARDAMFGDGIAELRGQRYAEVVARVSAPAARCCSVSGEALVIGSSARFSTSLAERRALTLRDGVEYDARRTRFRHGRALRKGALMSCPACGAPVPEGTSVCEACGRRVSEVRQSTAYAGFWLRLVAYAIDALLLSLVSAPLFAVLARDAGLPQLTFQQLVDPTMMERYAGPFFAVEAIVFVALGLYFSLMESSSWQATLGKRMAGLRVTDLNGDRISFGRATARYFAKFISNFTFFIGYIMAGFTEKKQALHDIMVGTLVMKPFRPAVMRSGDLLRFVTARTGHFYEPHSKCFIIRA